MKRSKLLLILIEKLAAAYRFRNVTRRLFYTFILLFFADSLSAQYRFDQWTADNGLPQNSVTAIAQTSDGYLWLTTNDGLVRFDGVRFTVFNKGNSPNLPSNRLRNMLADGNDLWILTEEDKLVRFRDGKFRSFTTADGLASNAASFIAKGLRRENFGLSARRRFPV